MSRIKDLIIDTILSVKGA